MLSGFAFYCEDIFFDEHRCLSKRDHSQVRGAKLHEVSLWELIVDSFGRFFFEFCCVYEIAAHLKFGIEIVESTNDLGDLARKITLTDWY